MSGQLCWGSYFDHLLSWMPHFADANVLMLRYEDLCENLQGEKTRNCYLQGYIQIEIRGKTLLAYSYF